MLISDWSSDVCSSDLRHYRTRGQRNSVDFSDPRAKQPSAAARRRRAVGRRGPIPAGRHGVYSPVTPQLQTGSSGQGILRSEEHTSELQSLMRISYAVVCLENKHSINNDVTSHDIQ